MKNKPDYFSSVSLAEKILLSVPNPKIPIDIFSLVKGYKDIKLYPYSRFAELNNMSFNEVVNFADSESGCYIYFYGKHMILYNDRIESEGHIRWTIAHEFGHYIMKHCENNPETIICRNSLSNEQYDVLEKEANSFAKTLLAHAYFIHKLGLSTPNEVKRVFLLSFTASLYALENYNKYKSNINLNIKKELLDRYKNALVSAKFTSHCLKCSNVFSIRNVSYCPICGSEELFIEGGNENMKYSEIEIDERGKAKICPICKNEDTSIYGEYCQICGTLITNKCIRHDGEPCCDEAEILKGDARFCPFCGEQTPFGNKLLSSWKDEIHDEDEDLSFLG